MGNGDENVNDDRSIKEFENMVEENTQLEEARINAQNFIQRAFDEIGYMNAKTCAVKFEDVLDIAQHDLDFHGAIWEASTSILPNLEVQVVIDGKNNCFVTTGSSGYVEFEKFELPNGVVFPIRCWIHTHPFGAAYFSGTDINTVSIWQNIAGFNNKPMMESAYVLGGEGHYGFWTVSKPNQLDIYEKFSHVKTQTWSEEE
jgi:hypothetical protein